MKLAFITDEATQSVPEAIVFAQANGFDGVELRSADEQTIDQTDHATLRQWRAMLDDNGLAVCALSSSFLKCERGEGMEEREFAKLQRLCDAADILGCRVIRGFALFAPPTGPEPIEALAPLFHRPLQLLRERGKLLALECDPGVNTSNHAALAALLALLDDPHVGALYDPGNDVFDPLGERPYPEGYEAIAGRLLHVHVKDAARPGGKPECVRVGDGLVHYPALLARLVADGYDGWLSLEPHYRKGNHLTEEQMRVPQGGAFSAGGWGAVAECGEALRALLDAVKGATP